MKIFWRVSYWLCRTLTYVFACKLVNNHCTLCQFHTWRSHQSCWGSNGSEPGTQWSHGMARSVPCVCVWALKLISSWCCSGAARVTSHWRYVTKWLLGGFCHDMMNASGLPALDSSRAIFFFHPPGVWLQLELAAEENPRRRTSGRSSPWNLNCEISPATSTGQPSWPQRSSSDSLPSAGSKKEKKKSKTLPVCYWFKYFPKLQAQETVVVLAARPVGRQKTFQCNIGLKNDQCKRETG